MSEQSLPTRADRTARNPVTTWNPAPPTRGMGIDDGDSSHEPGNVPDDFDRCCHLATGPRRRRSVRRRRRTAAAAARRGLRNRRRRLGAGGAPSLSAGAYDLLLMDLNYARDTTSGREGLELLAEVHARDPLLPVIVMTGWGSIETAVEAMRRGARTFVHKPWDNASLGGESAAKWTRRVARRRADALRRASRTRPAHAARAAALVLARDPGCEMAAHVDSRRIGVRRRLLRRHAVARHAARPSRSRMCAARDLPRRC